MIRTRDVSVSPSLLLAQTLTRSQGCCEFFSPVWATFLSQHAHPANTVTVWVCLWAFIMMVFWLQGGRWSKLRNFTAALFFSLKGSVWFFFCYSEIMSSETISEQVDDHTVITTNTHCSLIWLNLTHTPSCCQKYSPEHQMWINSPLKVVHSSCTASSCFSDFCKKKKHNLAYRCWDADSNSCILLLSSGEV